ncbi:MAG: long-chain acyl-CoA synthetase [Rhodothermales bacterium]|jgi:long-chain acyl-CoA synthetase
MQKLVSALADPIRKVRFTGEGNQFLSGADLIEVASELANLLVDRNVSCAAIRMDNGIDWVCADLACMMAGIPLVPLPFFFTPSQTAHAAAESGIDALIGTSIGAESVFEGFKSEPASVPLQLGPTQDRVTPAGTAKLTFTSGTTGTPKGVCLSADHQLAVAQSLASATEFLNIKRHLSVLPLPILLENVAGVYAALLSGASVCLPSLAETGVSGSSGFDPSVLLTTLRRYQPDSMILLPQMLKSLVQHLRAKGERLDGLKLVAVGGARSAPELIHAARAIGIPAYEGYGLTECSSVVAFNLPGSDKPGSVGRSLPHQAIRISDSGEIEVRDEHKFTYLGQPANQSQWLATGDLGETDVEGFLFVRGRRKQVLITAFGRNVSPEWVESELLAGSEIAQVMVLGDGLPGLGALIVPFSEVTTLQLKLAVERCNARLPDYARVIAFRTVDAFSQTNQQLTANGRIRREVVLATHSTAVQSLIDQIESDFSGVTDDLLQGTIASN